MSVAEQVKPMVPGVPSWYVECFRTALRRVAVVLNSRHPYERCLRTDLRQADEALDAHFSSKEWGRDLIQFQIAITIGQDLLDQTQ